MPRAVLPADSGQWAPQPPLAYQVCKVPAELPLVAPARFLILIAALLVAEVAILPARERNFRIRISFKFIKI